MKNPIPKSSVLTGLYLRALASTFDIRGLDIPKTNKKYVPKYNQRKARKVRKLSGKK